MHSAPSNIDGIKHAAHEAATISVIIPALNEAENIGLAISSAVAAGADEILVADGGSSDATREIVSRHVKCKLIEAPRGRAIQQNVAASQARGDLLVFLHADNRLHPKALQQVRDAYQSIPTATNFAGAFRQRIESDGLGYRLLEWGNACRVLWRGNAYGDQTIFCSRRLFERIGGFPEEPLLEDLLFSAAVRRITRLQLLDGPVFVSPRRWQRRGIARQTLLNWSILLRHRCGVSPKQLAASYRRHDQ